MLLKNTETLNFSQLTDLTAVDYPDRLKRFELVYQLLSMRIISESNHLLIDDGQIVLLLPVFINLQNGQKEKFGICMDCFLRPS